MKSQMIVLTLTSILLGASLAVVASFFVQSESSIGPLQQEVSSLREQMSSYQANVTSLRNELKSLNYSFSIVSYQLSKDDRIIGLATTNTWMDQQSLHIPAGTRLSFNFSAGYAGYVIVNVSGFSVPETYLTVAWTARGINYNQTVRLQSPGVASFPVLPSMQSSLVPCSNAYCMTNTSVQVWIGNGDAIENASVTVSISYVY